MMQYDIVTNDTTLYRAIHMYIIVFDHIIQVLYNTISYNITHGKS